MKCSNGKAVQIDMPGVPLGSFGGSTYDDFQVPLAAGDVFVLCSDGIFEAFDEAGQEFGADAGDRRDRAHARCSRRRKSSNEVFGAVQPFCGDAPQSDDRTVVVVKINQLGPQSGHNRARRRLATKIA